MTSTVALRPPQSLRRADQKAPAIVEFLVGCLCLGVAALAGLAFVHRPWPNRVDAIGLRLWPADLSSRWATDITRLGSTTLVVAGVIVLAAIAALSRDWRRALACVIAPLGAVLVVEQVAKPLVGRHFEGSSALSYPSGTVTAVAALATAAFVVAPLIAKPTVAVIGGVLVGAVCIAVVILRWHYPTDALGGVCVGVGTVFTLDGALHCFSRPRRARSRPDAVGGP